MMAEGPLDEIFRRLRLMRVVHVQTVDESDELLARIRTLPGVESVERQADRIAVSLREDSGAVENLHDGLVGLGARLRMFQPEALDMETAFMKLTEGRTA